MPNYKSIEAAIKDLQPNLQKIGSVISDSIRKYIELGKVKGDDLKEVTKQRKRPELRMLYHGGDMVRNIEYNVSDDNNSVDIGFTDKKHDSRSSTNPLPLSVLAEVHNEGKLNSVVPKREFLTNDDKKEWLEDHKREAEKEYNRQLRAKGII
jgi:hypothetical protein